MVEIEVSTIPDGDIDVETMQALAEQFEQSHNIKVRIRQMKWATAWTELFSIASHHKGPDVSHIGGTWLPSLAMMNTLRPFRRDEIEVLGGDTAFMAPTWSSSKMQDSETVWAIPWTGYMYVICYRKDLFKQAGVNEAHAFADLSSFRETITKLRSLPGDITPWINPMILPPYLDYVHTCAAWVWSSGGTFLDPTGKHVVLDSSAACRGLTTWLETYLATDEADRELPFHRPIELFGDGRVAAVLLDIRMVDSFVATGAGQIGPENLGIVPLTNIPWCGGGSFVVWNHTSTHLDRERAAVAFVQFMTSKANNVLWARTVGSMPARVDALDEIYFPGHPLREAVMLASKQGQSYPTVPVWRRIEYQIAQTLNEIIQKGIANPGQDLEAIVHTSIDPLVQRLNLALEG
jgi:ABC-type glycerol-3-phosphate transport system substrate-binding protein